MGNKDPMKLIIKFGITGIFAVMLDVLLCLVYQNDTSHFIIHFLIIFLFVIGWALYFLSVHYENGTGGRNYLKDRFRYERSYGQLLRYFRDADPYKLDVSTLPVEDWHHVDGVILGKIGDRLIMRESRGVGNLAVFSLPGGGKTTAQIIPTALRFGGSVLAIDIKGDILHATREHRKRIKVFAPDDLTASCHYNPLYGIEKLSNVERRAYIEQLAYTLLPDTQDDDGKYFIEGGRDYFCGVALDLLHRDIHATFPEIAEAIVTGNAFDWTTRIVNEGCNMAKSYVASYMGSNEKNVAGAYGVIVKCLRPYYDTTLSELLDGDVDCITPETLENGWDIYIEIPQDKIQQYAPITAILVQHFMAAFMRRPDVSSGTKTRPIIFLLDEFPQLQLDYKTLSSALATLRSKGVSLYMAMQSIAQLTQLYGDAGFRSIIDTCAYISIMSAQDTQSRKYFSELCGTRKVLKIGTSQGENSSSRSTQEEREPIFQPEDFGNLNDDVIIIANGKYIRAQKTYFFK